MRVKRYFLELKLSDYKDHNLIIPKNINIKEDKKKNFQINKFFYKKIGIDHYWRDRLVWTDKEWLKYVLNKNLETWVMRKGKELIGFYEKETHKDINEGELINMGILKDFREKKYGSTLLSHVIKNSLSNKESRLWVHTCSLDHKNALSNYKSRGFKIFKEEEISFVA